MKSALDRINAVLEKESIPLRILTAFLSSAPVPYSALSILTPQFGTFMDFLEFWTVSGEERMRFSDVVKACVSLGTGKVSVEGRRETRGRVLSWRDAK